MKTSFILMLLSLFTSPVYAHSDFCPEAALSEEQKAQIKEQKQTVWADFHAHILETVPTSEEQKTALSECFENRKKYWKNHRNFCPEAKLSEEQKAQVKELRENFRSSTQELDREGKQAARKELQQNILETVPTSEEQKTALSECFENRKKHRKNRRNFCPEAELSEEQKSQIKEQKRAAWANFHAHVLETVPTSEEQKAVLSECFENRKKCKKQRH